MGEVDNRNELRKKVLEVFKVLRKRGFIARANFYCCSTCAVYAIDTDYKKMQEAKKSSIVGYCFWHNQDEDGWKAGRDLHLGYGQLCGDDTICDNTTRLVGQKIAAALTEAGIDFEWDGSAGQKIKVLNTTGYEH